MRVSQPRTGRNPGKATTIPINWDDHNRNTSFWFVVRSAGASVTSASANFTPSGAYSQFVVSHCTRGESCRSAAAAPPVVLARKPVPRWPRSAWLASHADAYGEPTRVTLLAPSVAA